MIASLEALPADFPALLGTLADAPEAERARPALTFYAGRRRTGGRSYGELLREIDALAGCLHGRLGVRPGDRVALLAPNRIEIPALVLAIMRLGAIVVPLNPGAPPEDWSFVLEHSGARGLLAGREQLERAGTAALEFARAIDDLESTATRPPAGQTGSDTLADQAAVILYTSGTTGHPKGVALSHGNLLGNAWSMARNFRLEGTTQFAVLPLYHAHAFGFGLMTALLSGGQLIFSDGFDPFAWARIVKAESVEITSVVPTLLPLLLGARLTRERVPTLRAILVSSAPLASSTARAFEEHTGIPLVHGWGLSEYTNFACCLPASLDAAAREHLLYGFEVPSVGPALEGTQVSLRDSDGAEVAAGAQGELWVRGHSRMLGYFRDAAATRETLRDGWLRSGDLGFWIDHAGARVYFVTGRIKEIIIRGADKLSPLALERTVTQELPVLEGRCVALGFPHRLHGEEVGLYVEQDAPDAALQTALRRIAEALPLPQRPKVVLFGARPIPRTHTGKVQRRKLLPLFEPYAECTGGVRVLVQGAD